MGAARRRRIAAAAALAFPCARRINARPGCGSHPCPLASLYASSATTAFAFCLASSDCTSWKPRSSSAASGSPTPTAQIAPRVRRRSIAGADILIKEPWSTRRKHLERLLRRRTNQRLRLSDSIPGDGEEINGGAAYNNEFGRPNLAGYFRTMLLDVNGEWRGYHKPIMIAGGVGNVRPEHAIKGEVPAGAKIVLIGGPAMLIGLGGGAASSLAAGTSDAELDFASVQRDNPEMQRRCQEVIDRCWALGPDNPIISIHDVGAGALDLGAKGAAGGAVLDAALLRLEVPLERGLVIRHERAPKKDEPVVLGQVVRAGLPGRGPGR